MIAVNSEDRQPHIMIWIIEIDSPASHTLPQPIILTAKEEDCMHLLASLNQLRND